MRQSHFLLHFPTAGYKQLNVRCVVVTSLCYTIYHRCGNFGAAMELVRAL